MLMKKFVKKRVRLISFFLLLSFMACKKNSSQSVREKNFEYMEYVNSETKYDSIIRSLKQGFVKGTMKPMDIIQNKNLYALVDDPLLRSRTRALLKFHASQSHAKMVRDDEAGERIFVSGRILDESTQRPLQNVVLELVHTDTSGLYFSEPTTWNPRIFAYLKTDEKGAFGVETIYPGSYPEDNGMMVPSHVHFTIEAEGYKTYASEFVFDDDPSFDTKDNAENIPVAIRDRSKEERHYDVSIFLQPK